MPWATDLLGPIDAILDELDDVVEAALAEGADDLAGALAEGTPVDTGAMQASWEADQVGHLTFEVSPTVGYGDFVDVDTGLVPIVIDDINDRIGDAVSTLIEEA